MCLDLEKDACANNCSLYSLTYALYSKYIINISVLFLCLPLSLVASLPHFCIDSLVLKYEYVGRDCQANCSLCRCQLDKTSLNYSLLQRLVKRIKDELTVHKYMNVFKSEGLSGFTYSITKFAQQFLLLLTASTALRGGNFRQKSYIFPM